MARNDQPGGDQASSLTVARDQAGLRLDVFIRERFPGCGRSRARALLRQGAVLLNDRRATAGQRLEAGDRVNFRRAPEQTAFEPQVNLAFELELLFEDAHLVAVNKPPHLPSHPLRSDERDTVVNFLLARFPEMLDVGYRPREGGLVHRLDGGTSGLMLAARTRPAFEALRLQLRSSELDKRYLALCAGELSAPIELRHRLLVAHRRKVVVQKRCSSGGVWVRSWILRRSLFDSRTALGPLSLLWLKAPRAVRHQLRAQLAAIGHPIVGDRLYQGPELAPLDRHFLHASEIRFRHPVSARPLRLRAPLSDDLRSCLAGIAP